jgi:hypothetical protein
MAALPRAAISGMMRPELCELSSSNDNWLNLSEAERDEWRGYFDRMLEGLHRLGYAMARDRWSTPFERRSAQPEAQAAHLLYRPLRTKSSS